MGASRRPSQLLLRDRRPRSNVVDACCAETDKCEAAARPSLNCLGPPGLPARPPTQSSAWLLFTLHTCQFQHNRHRPHWRTVDGDLGGNN